MVTLDFSVLNDCGHLEILRRTFEERRSFASAIMLQISIGQVKVTVCSLGVYLKQINN